MPTTYTCQRGPLYSRFGPDFPTKLRDYLFDRMGIVTKNARHNARVRYQLWDGVKRFFTPSTASFLTGLDTWVVELLREKNVTVRFLDEEIQSLGPRMAEPKSRIKLRDYQAATVEEALKLRRGIIQAAVNAGKTEIALEIIRRLRIPTAYIVPTQRLYEQALDAFQERLPSMPLGELKGKLFEPQLITVATIQTLSQALGSNEKRGNPDIKLWIKNVECLVMDECHHAASPKWSLAFKRATRATYRFGLSATPLGMSDERDRMLMGLTGALFGSITAQDLEERGLSVKIEVRFIKYPQVQGSLNHLSGQDYRTIHMLGIQENEERALALYQAAQAHLLEKETVLIFVDEIDHGNRILELAPKWLAGKPQTLYGTESKERRATIEEEFRTHKRPILITTLLKEGVNIPEIDVIINASGKKSEWLTRQQGGRVARTRPGKDRAIVYDFLDAEHNILLNHSSARHAAYKKEGYLITVLDLTTGVSS